MTGSELNLSGLHPGIDVISVPVPTGEVFNESADGSLFHMLFSKSVSLYLEEPKIIQDQEEGLALKTEDVDVDVDVEKVQWDLRGLWSPVERMTIEEDDTEKDIFVGVVRPEESMCCCVEKVFSPENSGLPEPQRRIENVNEQPLSTEIGDDVIPTKEAMQRSDGSPLPVEADNKDDVKGQKFLPKLGNSTEEVSEVFAGVQMETAKMAVAEEAVAAIAINGNQAEITAVEAKDNRNQGHQAKALEPYSQIGQEIQSRAAEKRPTEFTMQLEPLELGKIDVKLKVSEGKMMIDIAAANSKTHALLAGQIDKLVMSMGLRDVSIENVQVSQQASLFEGGSSEQPADRRSRQKYQGAGGKNQMTVKSDINFEADISYDTSRRNDCSRMNYLV